MVFLKCSHCVVLGASVAVLPLLLSGWARSRSLHVVPAAATRKEHFIDRCYDTTLYKPPTMVAHNGAVVSTMSWVQTNVAQARVGTTCSERLRAHPESKSGKTATLAPTTTQ